MALVAVVTPTAVLARSNAEGDGFLFTSPDGRYTVVFPAAPAPFGGLTDEAFVGDLDLFGSGSIAGLLLTGQAELSADGLRDADELAAAMAEEIGVVGGASWIELRGVPGVEWSGPLEASTVGRSMRARAYITNDSLYVLMVIGTESEVRVDDPDVAGFFDSFDFVKDAF